MKFYPIIIAILMALLFRVYLVAVYKVPSQTMAPTILAGDYVLASQMHKMPAVGELVVFIKDSRTFIKRVVAVGNDEIEYHDGELFINSVKCDYVAKNENEMSETPMALFQEHCGSQQRLILRPSDLMKNSMNLAKTRIATGEIFVIGDNRNFENNLTNAETIRYDQIVGKPLIVWMSYSSTQDFISKSLGVRWNRILTILR